MFKKFLATLTDHIIGKYFENFNSESLSYGLLNGNITLSNLNLKKDTLNSLFGIPLTLRSGSVGNVSIFIPYTHLWSQAWQLSLENVNLVAYASADDLWDNLNRSPLADSPNISSVSRNQSEKCVAKIIPENQKNECSCEPSVIGKYSLDQMEKRWYQTITGGKLKDAADMAALVAMDSRSDNSSWWSYISSVGYNIIRSLQIEIRHVSLSLIDQNTPENQDPFNNLSCDYCSNFGTFTISLEHLTLETTNSRWERTTSTSHEPVEYKLISVYGLNITWSPKLYVPVKMTNYPVVTEQSSNESDTNLNENLLHILPPCHLTGHLKRNQINNGTINSESTTPSTTMSSCQSEFSNKAQIELHICLSQLDIQISQEFCHNILQLSEVLTSQYERLKQLKRRPSNVVKGSGQWWRYAAGEIRPQLRILFHSTLGHTSLSELALEAKSSVNYVKAYTVYLIQGLLPSSDVSKSTTKCLITTEQLHDICTNLKYTSELHLERLKHDQLWPVQRIAILRLIAMRRAGILLVKLLKSDSKGSVLITNDPEMPNSTGNDNPLATNQSWYYNWWRFSSWWGINSFLPSLSSSSVAVNELQSNVEKLNEPVTDQQTIDSELNHSMADTIFELLDEFAAHTNNIDYACITYPIFVQFVCIVDGCSLKLIDHQGSVEMHTQSAFVNISGQQMYFILEIRPQCNSYRLSTYIQSFTVQDERYMLKNCTHSSSTQSIPIFPVVVFPYYGGKSSSISKRLCSDVVPDLDRRVFSLTYEVNPAQKNVDFILSIHTEPLQVVFQPELIRQIMNFIHVASSAAPLHVETSTRRRFTSFKECTSKHSYSSSFKDTSNNTDVDFVNRLKEDKISNSSKLSQLIPSRVSTSMKPNNRWAIHFDITTLRVLFPNIFIQNNNNNQQPFTSNSVTCLLCDFSHLQMTNWPEIHTTSNVNKVDNVNKAYHVYTNPSQTLQQPSDAKDFDNDDDEQDEFKTPCSTPAELSEIEDNVEEEEENVKHEVEKSSQRKNQIIVTDERDFNTKSTELLTNDNNTDIYASYMITVENIRVLTGCLNLLHKLDLWSCYNVVTDDKLIESKSEESTFKFDSDTFSFNDNSILRVSKSTIISRLCLVDPFNLTLLISRRISYPVHDFTPNLNHVSSDSIPPFIWMTLKQESCVLRLSNKKISDLLSCLNACQRQLNGIQPMKQRYSMMMKRYARSRTQTVSCSYSSVHSSRNAFKHRSYHTSISSPHCSCHSLSGTCCSEQPVDFCRLTVFNFKRKQLIGTYSIQSFSIQFESKDRLLAECRFDEAMFNVSVYRGSPIAYCVRFKLGSISMVDAVSNLGGVYDVIVNSNEKVKRTDSPNSTVTSYNEVNTDSTHIINGDSSLWTNSFIPLSDHICPEKEFSINESCNFLTGYLNWCPTSDCSNCLSHNNLLRMGGTCFIQLNIRLLNITGYPITIMAINRFLNDLYTSSKLSGESYPDNTGEYHLNNSDNFVSTTYRSSSPWVKYNLKLSIDHFKLLMLNKINSSQPDEHKYRNLELSVKRVAEIIFSGLHVNLNHSSSLDSLSLKLRYFQIIPLCNPKFPIGQYLLGPAFSLSTVDGHCPCSNLITLKITAGSVTTTNDFQRKLLKRIQLIVSNIVYVHFVHEFHEIITWFIQLIPLFKGVHSTVGNDQCFIMDNHHSLKQNQEGFFATWPEFLITFINPLILIPCNTNSRSDQFNQFLLMGTKFIKINYYPLYCNRLLSNSSTVIIHQEINNSYSVQLCFMHFGVFLYVNVDADENDNKKPSGNSYSSTACAYFLNLSDIHKFWLQVSKLDDIMSTRIRKTQSSRHHVIVAPTDFSFCVTYVKCDLSRYPSIPIPELQSFRFNISDLAMMHSMINNTDITSDDANKSNPPYPYSPILSSTSSVSNMNLLLFTEPINSQLIVEAYIHSVQINLTKMNWNFLNVVVHELIKEYYDYYAVSCSNTESIQPNNTDVLSQLPYMEHSVMLPTTDYHSVKSTHSMEFGLFIKCTQILVIILADLDIIPISLASLTFDSFSFSSSIHIYSNGITMPSCIHITLNGVDLQNQLIKSNYVEDNNINDKRQQFLLTSTRTSLKRKRSTSFNHNDVNNNGIQLIQINDCVNIHLQSRKRSLSCESVNELNQISPISLRIIILSDEHQTFCQTKYFGKFIFDTINVQLSFEPWILLLDFFDLCDYKEEISQMTVPESHHDVCHRFDSHSSISSNDPIVAFLLDIGSMHCFVNDSNQEKDEEVDDKSRNTPHHISNIESNLALLSFIGMKAHINYFLIDVTDRRFSSPSFNLPIDYSYLEIKGQMYDIQLHALQEKHAYLYPTRLITAPTMSHAVDTIKNFDNSQSSGVVFQFIKPAKHLYKSLSSDSASDVDNDQDIYLSVQMPSVTYIHTQSFLTSFIDSLMNFSEHYDFLRQTRGAVKGFQIPLVPPPSSRVRIHIYGGPLNLILPVDSHSSNVLIANIDHLKLYNTFLRNIANQEDVNNESKFIKSKANEKCDDRYFFSAIRSTSKTNLLGLLECSNLNSEDANDSHPTLIDRMTMEFHGFSLYCAEQVNDNLTQKSDGKHIGIHLPNQSFIPIGGSNYSSSCPNNAKLLFNPIDCISLFLEHSLTSDKVHKIPDWKLIGEFANCQVHLDLYAYCLILGVLSRNIGESSESYFVDTSKPFPESNIWSKFTVDIRLKSVQATLFDYLKSSIAIVNNPITIASMNDFLINESCQFAIIDFCDALFTFEYFSNQSTTIQLQCFDINLIRIPGDTDKEQGQFILKSFTTTTSSSTQSALHEETQHEDKALKTPKLFIFSNSSSLHSTFLFSSTRLHLMFDLDWLLRFQRFIISSPMSSYTGNSQTVYTSQSNLLSSGTDRTTVDAYTTRTISKLNLYSDDLIYNHSRTSISPSIPDTYLHIWIDDCEVCMPYENSCFLIKSSARLSRHARKFSSFGKIYDEIYADILQFRIYHHLQSLLIIPNSMKFHYKLYHTSMGKSPSSSQLSSSLSTTTGTFMNTGLPSDIIKWSTGVFFELPHRQRNFLHPSQMQLQLQASLTAPSIHITSNYSDIQIALHFISFLMLTKSSSANVQSNNNVGVSLGTMPLLSDTHSSMRNACDRSLLSTFWPNIFADYISKQLINFNISIALSICLFDRNSSSFQSSLSSEEIPLIKVCVESMKFFWKRSSLQASLECNGISCSYYNQNLIAWEPVLEPWSCSINWSEKFEQDFSKNISFSCSSQYCLKLNMTVPLVQLIRRLLNTMIVKVSQTETNESTTTNELASNQQDFSLLSTQNTGSFILVNKTGTCIRYKLVNNNSMESLLKPQILIPDILDDDFTNDNNDKSNDLAPDSHAYLPIKISSFAYNSSMVTNKYESNVDSIQLPCLLVQVAGWKPIYPIALDRLGTYHRVIERLENAEPIILKNEQNECWKYHLPIFNRLVIDIVRDHNVHYVIYLRSGLTITNDLNQSINIGLEIFPPKSSELLLNQSSSDDNDDVDYLTNTLNGSIIFLTVCKPRCTYPVSINHVGLMSLGLGNLCFSPVKTVMNRQNLSSFFINNISDQSKLFTSNLSDWCIVYYHQNNETITEEEQSKSPPHSSLISTSSTSSSFVDFVEKRKIASSTRMIDWTSLKQSNELLEAVLISTCQLPTSSLTMHNVNSLHRFQQNPTNLLPSLNKSSTSNNLNNNSKFHICVTVVRDQFPLDPQWSKLYSNQWYSNYKLLLPITIPGHHITIGPVLRITNLLPCDMMYYFAKTEISGILGSKEEACVYNLFPVTTINFGIHLDGFPKCDTLSIPTNTYNQKVLIRLYDTLNRPLELQVHVCSRAFGARHLTISPVICLLNKSGLPLIFAQSSSLSSNQFGLSSLASSSQTSILAAGQTEEHEQACVLMPLLFSFANKSEGYLLRVRIGKFYHSVNDVIPTNENDKFHTNNMKHCTWSPGISLDKRGVDVLQLKVYTDNNRLSSMLYLGFEVHTEQDANNSLTTSTIVTFRPRYIIENLTQYQLNITQRYCLKSVNNFPASIVIHSNRSQAFHWSSDELDRLLCIRAAIRNSSSSVDHLLTGSDRNNLHNPLWTMWSGGFQIDHAHSFIIMLRLNHFHQIVDFPSTLFFRVVIVLQSATFFVRIQEYYGLPPFRFENHSPICVYYCQVVDSMHLNGDSKVRITSTSDNRQDVNVLRHSMSVGNNDVSIRTDDKDNEIGSQNLDKWNGGACPSFLIPGSTVPYALEEPCGSSSIILSVQDDLSEIYNLDKIGVSKTLRYDNFVYLTLLGPLMDPVVSGKTETYSLRRRSSSLPTFVFDVLPGSNYVICATKSSRRHSQLWKLSDDGLMYHENTSLSTPTSSGSSRQQQHSRNKYQFVLDIDRKVDSSVSSTEQMTSSSEAIDAETLKHFEVVQLVIAKQSKRRKAYQTWRIDQNGLLVNSALFCVQIRRDLMDIISSSQSSLLDSSFEENNGDVLNLSHILTNELTLLAARPRPSATRLISASITSAVILPIWLRPGSGRLKLSSYLDKATRVLCIEDEDVNDAVKLSTYRTDSTRTNPRWGRTSVTPEDAYRLWDQSVWDDPSCKSNCLSTKTKDYKLVTNFKANLTLPNGIGISVISIFAEELIYTSLIDINLLLTRTYSKVLATTATTTTDLISSEPSKSMKHAQSWIQSCDILNSNRLSTNLHHGLNVFDHSYHPDVSQSYFDDNNVYTNENENYFTKVSETFNLLIGRFQIDSQFPGAFFPVLLFQINTRLLSNDHHHNDDDVVDETDKPEMTSMLSEQVVEPNYTNDEAKYLSSKLKITYSRDDIQNDWPLHLFKIFRVDVSPLNVQAEELLLLKLIQFYQHAFEDDVNTEDTDEFNNSSAFLTASSDTLKDSSVHNLINKKHTLLYTKSEHKIFWFDQFIISPIHMKLSVQTAKSSLTDSYLSGAKRLLPSLMSFTGAEIQLDPVEKLYIFETIPQLLTYLNTYYRLQLRAHAFKIFGSVDFLGNPIGLINDLSSGISGLVELDVGGLIRHVAHGVGDSAAKVAGSVSQLLNAISLDDKHQQERAAILGSGRVDSSLLQTPQSVYDLNYYDDNEISFGGTDESLDDFELTCRDIYSNVKSNLSRSGSNSTPSLSSSQSSSSSSVAQYPKQTHQSFDTSNSVTAPFNAGVRGLMHGIVGGMTSIVTQPYRGAKEDQLRGFVYGVGRGLLGTVTKPVGGLFDFVSGMMSSISEAACPSNLYRPRRRRPRRAGLSKYFYRPLTIYNLDESIVQIQIHHFALFNSTRCLSLKKYYASLLNMSNSFVTSSSSNILEIDNDHDNINHWNKLSTDIDPCYSFSRMLYMYALSPCLHAFNASTSSSYLRYLLLNSPESILHILPVQLNGVVVLITDQAIWCIRDKSLRNWIISKNPTDSTSNNSDSNSSSIHYQNEPVFFLSEHTTTVMFMLHYHRLDQIHVMHCMNTTTTTMNSTSIHHINNSLNVNTTNSPVYVIFSTDCGISKQQLRCDYLSWGLDVTFLVRNAQFRYAEANMRVSRLNELSSYTTITSSTSSSSSSLSCIPHFPNHPVALAYSPICYRM